jgi:alanine dehydrogenase
LVEEDPMIIGVPREVKTSEFRVAITPVGVRELVAHGHEVLIESDAGEGSTIHDEEYESRGARIVGDPADVFAEADMILKVKEPQPSEFGMFRPGQLLFTYLHLAAYPKVADALMASGVTSIAYETVQLPDRSLPLLAPMSEIAGRMATQVGARFLEKAQGGRGVLLGGIPGVRPAKVVVIGGGTSGANAAAVAVGMQAHVTIVDRDLARLRALDAHYQGRITTMASNRLTLEELVIDADLVIGSVLVPGASAPKLVTEDMVRSMPRGAVLVDIAIDQGDVSRPVGRRPTPTRYSRFTTLCTTQSETSRAPCHTPPPTVSRTQPCHTWLPWRTWASAPLSIGIRN